ncbi:hypothetical protein BHE74_00030055, partial [Ensete ventricosum]
KRTLRHGSGSHSRWSDPFLELRKCMNRRPRPAGLAAIFTWSCDLSKIISFFFLGRSAFVLFGVFGCRRIRASGKDRPRGSSIRRLTSPLPMQRSADPPPLLRLLFGITFAVSGTSRDWYLHEVDVRHGMPFSTVSLVLYAAGLKSRSQSSSFKPHVTGDFIHDWYHNTISHVLSSHFTVYSCGLEYNLILISWDLTSIIEYSEELTGKSMYLRRILKLPYGVNLQKLLEESCLPLVTGNVVELITLNLLEVPWGQFSFVLAIYEARCSQKYKEIWAEYCQLVPWRIPPYVY